jgi:CheY-like chemotaxis protein
MTALRVLHVDDEADIREVVEIALGLDPGLSTRSCASGQEALATAADWIPDMILLDVMMPVMDGATTLARLRENSRTAHIPVIFMTARAQSREIDLFRSLGAIGVIPKPFDPMTLAASVRAYIQPPDSRLGTMRQEFLQRVDGDLVALAGHWYALEDRESVQSSLAGIRRIAHGLAGAGGIFGFDEISEAAASLEGAVILEGEGSGTIREIGSALGRVLACRETKGHSPHESSVRAPKMLIADDDRAILRLLADRCASVGFEVETATDGLQALIKANRSHPDILVIDVNMPEADGLAVCGRLLDPSKEPMDVIVITGRPGTETVERCDGLGASYVCKGPKFWSGLEAALTESFPLMAHKIRELRKPMPASASNLAEFKGKPTASEVLSRRLDR